MEPLERRVRFLLEMVDALGLTNCRVVRGRAEDVVTQCGDADVVISRAVAPLHRLVGWSAPLARDGGLVLAMKGESAREELAAGPEGRWPRPVWSMPEVLELGGAGGEVTYVIRARRRSHRNGRTTAPSSIGRRGVSGPC